MSRHATNSRKKEDLFEQKYGKDLLDFLINKIKGKDVLYKNSDVHITVDEERYPELNLDVSRSKAYIYMCDFTKEIVIEFLESETEKDNLGFNVIYLSGFKEYIV